jgi:23S rRNA pseudouridine1911/1915/1917 synthase
LASDRAEKQYLALVYGRVPTARGVVRLRLGRDPRDRRRVVALPDRGAESVTTFERLARARAAAPGLALLRCRLMTGRMHQIRVHLAAHGWPIVGDATYGEARWRLVADPALAAALAAFPRQALHAWRVAFDHPATGKRLEVVAPIPRDLAGLMDACNLVI